MASPKLTRSNRAGWLMALPGVRLIATFIILPFFLAFAFSLTNQRLASPNPTEYVGFENYSDLLAFALFAQIDVMTNGGPLDSTQALVLQAVERGYGKQDISGGSTISVILFLIVLAISLLQRWLTRERS
ncbi:MAG: hypothetical protein AAGA87_01220 [Pseudomonadota bacterium]